MSASLITIIFNVLLFVSIGFGFLAGAVRGAKKSGIRTAFLIGFLALFFFLSPVIANAVSGIQINESIGSIGSFLETQIKDIPEIADIYAGNPALQNLVHSLPAMLINIVIMIILVPLASFFSFLCYAIVKSVQKRKNKVQNSEKIYTIQNGIPVIVDKKQTQKKHAFWGGVIGAVAGFVMFFCMFFPITTTTKVVMEYVNTNVAVAAENNESGFEYSEVSKLLTNTLGEPALEYINAANTSIFSKISGLGNIDYALYDYITSFKLGDTSGNLRTELKTVADVTELALSVKALTQEEEFDISKINFEKLENALFALSNSAIITTVGADLLDYFVDKITNENYLQTLVNENKLTQNQADLIEKLITPLGEKNISFAQNFKANIGAITNALKAVVDSGFIKTLDGITENSFEQIFDNLESCLNGTNQNSVVENHDYFSDIISAIFDSPTLKVMLVGGVNVAVDMFAEWLEIALENQGENLESQPVVFPNIVLDGVNFEVVETNLNTILKKAVDAVGLYLDSCENKEFKLINFVDSQNFNDVFAGIGVILANLETLPLLTSTDSSQSIFEVALLQLSRLDIVNEYVDLTAENINWQTETALIAPALKVLNQNYTDNTKTQTLLEKLIDGGADEIVETDGFKELTEDEMLVLTTTLCESKILKPVATLLLEEIVKNLGDAVGVTIDTSGIKNAVLSQQTQTISGVMFDLISLLNVEYTGDFKDAILENQNLKNAVKQLLESLNANAESAGVFAGAFNAVCGLFEEVIQTANDKMLELVDENANDLVVTSEQLLSEFDDIITILSKAKTVADLNKTTLEEIVAQADGSEKMLALLNEMQTHSSGVFGEAYTAIFEYVEENYSLLDSVNGKTAQTIVWATVFEEIKQII